MLISDSRTIGLGSEEKTSSKLSCGDTEGETLRPAENVAIFSPPHPPRRDAVQTRGEKRSLSGLFDKKREMYGF